MLRTGLYFGLVLGLAWGWSSGLGCITLAQEEVQPPPESPRQLSVPETIDRYERLRYERLRVENSAQMEEAKQAAELLQAQIQKMRHMLQRRGMSEAAYPEILTQLQVQRINLSIEQAGLDAKSGHLQAILSKPPGETEDATLVKRRQMLEELLQLEQKELLQLQELAKAGVAASRQVTELRKRVLQVELQLLELESPRGPQSPETNWATEVLAKVAMDRIEVAAKLAKIDELLGSQQDVQSLLSEIEQLKGKLDETRVKQAYLQGRQVDLDRFLQLQQEFQTPLPPLKLQVDN
jgi:hypothetical protein